MNKDIVKKVFPQAIEDYENEICPICRKKVNVTKFKDQLSKKEFAISGMCQTCQDKVFK